MTSRRPYWCSETMKRQPCWCSKPALWELNSFLMQTIFFVPRTICIEEKQLVYYAKQQLGTCGTLFFTFIYRPCTTTTWKCLIASFMKDINKRRRISFSLSKVECGPQEINSREIRHFQQIGINATKIEKKGIHFKTDVTKAILVFRNNETAAMLVFQTGPVRVELFSYANDFFCSKNHLHRWWLREWKCSIIRSLSIKPKQAYYTCDTPGFLRHERKQPHAHVYLVL